MAVRKIIITNRDWMQHEDASFIAGNGSWALPLTNLLDARPQVVAEAVDSRDLNSTKFDVDLGGQRKVGLIWFVGLNTTSMGLIAIKAGTDPTFASNNYTASTTCWPQDSVAGENNGWGEWTLNGAYLYDTYAALGMPRFFVPPAVIACRYIRVEIRDTTNSGKLQIGCFGASEIWEPPLNFSYGWQITPIDESDIQRVPFGSTDVTQRGMRRRLNLGFPALPLSEVWARSFDLTLTKGRTKPLVVIPFSDTTEVTRLEKAGVYGFVSADSQLSNPYFERYAQPFQIDQAY